MTKDMTNGSPMKLILGFSIPLLFGYLFQQFYNLVDTLIVGRFLGVDALAAVGSTGSLNFLIIGFCMGVCNGFAIPLAHKFGAGDYRGLRAFMVNAIYLSAIFAVVMTAVTVVFCRPILELMRTPDNIIDGAYLYIVIIFAGIPATYLYNLISAIIRSMGDSKTPVVFLVISSVMNIVLDLVFIINLHLGVAGASLATVISQAVSAVWVMTFLTGKKTRWHLKRENLRVDAKIVLPCIALGLSPFVMQSTESLIAICFNSSLLRYGGDMAVGTMTVLTSIMQFSNMPLQGLTQGAQPIVSYNFGAKNAQRVRDAYFCLLRACFTYSMAIWLLVELFPRAFILIFNNDPALVEYAAWAVRIYMGCSGIFGIQIACQQTFVALGNAKTSLFLAVWRKIILLIPLIYILPHFFADKAFAVFLAEPVADFGAVALTSFTFYRQFRRSMRELEGAEATGER